MRSRNRTRTYNLPVNSRLLCQLSYAGSCCTRSSSAQVRSLFGGSSLACVTRLAHPGPRSATALSGWGGVREPGGTPSVLVEGWQEGGGGVGKRL